MRLAIPQWQGRISPVFDVAGSLLLIDLDQGGETNRREVPLGDDTPGGRLRRMADLNIDTLICGAISRPLEIVLLHSGIQVISQICGDVNQVLDAYTKGRIHRGTFVMPGCRGRRRRFRGGRGRG